MPSNVKTKTYADTFIFSIADGSTEHGLQKAIVEFIQQSDRIIPIDPAFKAVAEQIKLRQTTTVLYKILMRRDVVLCSYKKEMPATMKVFTARDIKLDKKKRVFIDCTGLVRMENGYWVCNEIDKLCSYLFAALINLLYHGDTNKLTSNASIIKSSTQCFVKMFTGIFNNLRVINYEKNILKVSYIAAVYYLYTVMGRDINYARTAAANAVKIQPREAQAYDIYYDIDKDLINIDTLIHCFAEVFHFKEITSDVYINRWSFVYGKGTMYGLEYLPAFLNILAYAFVGAYLNNQKSIESICRSDMVECASTILKVGAEALNSGDRITIETALDNIATRSNGLTDKQAEIVIESGKIFYKIDKIASFGSNRPVAIGAFALMVKHQVKKIMDSDDSKANKKAKLLKWQKDLKRCKAYMMNKGNLIPVVDRAIKEKMYDKINKIITDALQELEEEK